MKTITLNSDTNLQQVIKSGNPADVSALVIDGEITDQDISCIQLFFEKAINLKTLKISNCHPNNLFFQLFGIACKIAHLEEIDLAYPRCSVAFKGEIRAIGDKERECILGSIIKSIAEGNCQSLQSLKLTVQNLNQEGWDALRTIIKSSKSLKRVSLPIPIAAFDFSDEALKTMCAELKQSTSIVEIDFQGASHIYSIQLTDENATAIADLIAHSSSLQAINLTHKVYSNTGRRRIIKAIADSKTIDTLNLSLSNIDDANWQAMIKAIENKSAFKEIGMQNLNIDATTLSKLFATLAKLGSLEKISLDCDKMNDQNYRDFALLISKSSRMRKIWLSEFKCCDEKILMQIADAIKETRHLECFKIGVPNHIFDETKKPNLAIIFNALACIQTLKSIDIFPMSNDNDGNQAIQQLANVFKNSPFLQTILLMGVSFTQDQAEILVDAIKESTSLGKVCIDGIDLDNNKVSENVVSIIENNRSLKELKFTNYLDLNSNSILSESSVQLIIQALGKSSALSSIFLGNIGSIGDELKKELAIVAIRKGISLDYKDDSNDRNDNKKNFSDILKETQSQLSVLALQPHPDVILQIPVLRFSRLDGDHAVATRVLRFVL